MLKRTETKSSFGPDGRRLNSNHTFPKMIIQRRPFVPGFTIPSSLTQKFKRPMTKRRSYDKNAEMALKNASLGPKKRMDGMAKLLARAGKGLTFKLPQRNSVENAEETTDSENENDDDNAEEERPYEPLMLWQSPHNGGEAVGLPPRMVTELQADEYGIESEVSVMRPAPISCYSNQDQYVPPVLAKWLRPHQREGVKFMYECVMGMRDFQGNGCILADDMGLGKTLQSVTLIYSMLKTSIVPNQEPTAKRVIVVCPCSLVKNWDNEFVKWLGPGCVKTLALAESDKKTVEKSMDLFVKTKMFNVLICSYETIRTHINRLNNKSNSCDLLVCDEAHRLKNNENQTARALASLPCRRRVLLTGTPMQNDLQEFFAMVDFTNPGILGTQDEFRKRILFPVLRGREPDATDHQKKIMIERQQELSSISNEFILRRVNTLNAEHLPPKLVQVVCCNLTEIQKNMYQHLISSKDMQHVLDGKQVNCLSSIQMLMKLCNHPRLVAEDDPREMNSSKGRRASASKVSYAEDEKSSAAPGADGVSKYLPEIDSGRGNNCPVRPEWSGKMFVLYRLIREMRRPGNGNDKIVIVSNYTQTLDLIGRMCKENSWGFCRLDGSISMKKRQKMVDEFNDPGSSLIAFLLSSKAGGCGLNLIGGNRLVLFDPDWNPAVDKQAAARCWRDGQKKRCFTYRFLATGTVEEKIFQRQLSKEGLQSIVDDKEQVNALSTKDLRNLFKLRTGTPSDTHDKLRCERCRIVDDDTDRESIRVLPKQLQSCADLLEIMLAEDDASFFHSPLKPDEHGVTVEQYEKAVKQPIDLGTIKAKISLGLTDKNSYQSPSAFAKDVNRIFSNVMKVWDVGHELADSARRLQGWWTEQWANLVPKLMRMKPDDDDAKPSSDSFDNSDENNIASAFCQNERGDDYQEQIGMPDEENMRHWSHHHSTDTVDDPVFRAAMRGFDDVSFVFGLEVTWSLIQQRQQEEEERLAMLEMDRIQEICDNDEQIDSDHSHLNTALECSEPVDKCDQLITSTVTEETDVTTDDDDDLWNIFHIFSKSEIMGSNPFLCEIEGCRNVACSMWKSQYGRKSTVCIRCQEVEYGGFPEGMEPQDPEHMQMITTTCSHSPKRSNSTERNLSDDGINISSSPDTSDSIGSKWACSQCTYENKANMKKCDMCHSAKYPKKRKL